MIGAVLRLLWARLWPLKPESVLVMLAWSFVWWALSIPLGTGFMDF